MGHKTSADLLERRARPFNPKDAKDTAELLDMCVKALQDKRCSTREAALTALAGAMESLPPPDELDSRCFNIFSLCGVCIKEGSVKETRLAYRAVGLLALTLRAASPGILAESFPLLSRTIQGRGVAHDDTQTMVAALDCLAAITFAGALKKEDVERSMKAVWDVIFSPVSRPSKSSGSGTTKPSPQVLVAAVSTWTFFLTTIVAVTDALRKADSAVWNATVASLARLLDNDDRAVRMAAGEALAVCVELNLTQHAPRKDMDALAAKVSGLATEPAGKGVNNAMLPQQKELFRQIAAFLDRGERPMESMPTSLDGCVALEVSTWAKLVQLNFLRRFLGSSFARHVQGNELLKEAFSYGADEGKVLSVAKKKQCSNMEKELKVKRKRERWGYCWDYNIHCSYPYTVQRRPEALLQIGWQALNYYGASEGKLLMSIAMKKQSSKMENDLKPKRKRWHKTFLHSQLRSRFTLKLLSFFLLACFLSAIDSFFLSSDPKWKASLKSSFSWTCLRKPPPRNLLRKLSCTSFAHVDTLSTWRRPSAAALTVTDSLGRSSWSRKATIRRNRYLCSGSIVLLAPLPPASAARSRTVATIDSMSCFATYCVRLSSTHTASASPAAIRTVRSSCSRRPARDAMVVVHAARSVFTCEGVMGTVVTRNVHADTAATRIWAVVVFLDAGFVVDLEAGGKITSQIALSDRSTSSATTAPAKVTTARQSSAATSVGASSWDAWTWTVLDSSGNAWSSRSDAPARSVSARRPTVRYARRASLALAPPAGAAFLMETPQRAKTVRHRLSSSSSGGSASSAPPSAAMASSRVGPRLSCSTATHMSRSSNGSCASLGLKDAVVVRRSSASAADAAVSATPCAAASFPFFAGSFPLRPMARAAGCGDERTMASEIKVKRR
ncbi:hypothetical protein EJB05_24877, partial [Eragrostis curvula]